MLHASFEVARRLGEAGHDVTFLSWSPVGEAVEAQGVPFVQLPPFVGSPAPRYEPRPGQRRLGRTLGRLASRRERLVAGAESLRLDDHARTLRDLDADLALIDVEMHEAVLAAHRIGLPVLLLSPWYSLWCGTGQPPLQSPTVPGRGLRGHPLAVQAEWFRLGVRQRQSRLRRHLRGHPDRSDVLRHLARREGFSAREWVRASFPPPFVYRTLPVLSMTLAEMEFPQRRRPGLHYVGPMVHTGRHDPWTTPEVEARAEAVIAQCTAAGTPLVYVPTSSMVAGDTSFIRKLVGVFARRSDWHLVLGLGGRTDPEVLGPIPPNASVFPWAPQLQFLRAADAAVVHGGINTIHECLHFGVPMAVYSDGMSDQNGCAARVEYHQLGIRGAKSDSEVDIERAVENVLASPDIRKATGRFRGIYRKTCRDNALVRFVESYLPT